MSARRRCLGAIVAALALSASGGCGRNRTFYRQQADVDAYCLIDHKAAPAQGEPGSYGIQIDPRSRMFDPFDPDCEPQPPDDPASHALMGCVDCKHGSKCWRCLPQTTVVDNPGWQAALPRDASGAVPISLDEAVRLALIHSPDYQGELEDLYLSALDVSFERFRLDTQFFGGTSVFYTADGGARGGGDSRSALDVGTLRPGNRLRAQRLFATGGEMVVGFANSLVWQFSGSDDYASNTLLDFTLVQPLLRSGGRTRVLERLTIAERTLLANVRAMERYRRGFYLSVVTGRGTGGGPSRRGGFFGGSGLEGFSGVGGGGFGNVGNIGGFFGGGGGQGGGVTGGAGAAGAGGYMGLLQTSQQIRNQRANVAALTDSVDQLQASYDAGRIDRFQVDLARQALYNAQSQLLIAENAYVNALENFKIGLGLPPELEVRIDDPLLDRFNLLGSELQTLQAEVAGALSALRAARAARQAAAGAPPAAGAAIDLDAVLAQVAGFESAVAQRVAEVERDFAQVDAALPPRTAQLQRLALRQEVQQAEIDPKLFDAAELEARVARQREDFAALRRQFERIWARLERFADGDAPAGDAPHDDALVDALIATLTDLSGRLLELSLAQAGARLEAIVFEPVELTPEAALRIASVNREDWQNARAQLVDTWRLIYFNANDLLSDLDLVFSGDLGNEGDNPLRLRGTRGRLRVGVEFDAPLTRLGERNIYRQSLIEYQQARRNYYQYRDRVYQGLRNSLRQVRLNEINFELRRAAVRVAISQVDLTQLRLSEPPQPGVDQQFGDTTARDLVQSLADLLNVQNDFLSVWVNYEVQRLGLDFDLGIMELDAEGLRVDSQAPYEAYLREVDAAIAQHKYASDLFPGIDVAAAGELAAAACGPAIPLLLPPSVLPPAPARLPAAATAGADAARQDRPPGPLPPPRDAAATAEPLPAGD